jgi:hypothetical protein
MFEFRAKIVKCRPAKNFGRIAPTFARLVKVGRRFASLTLF